MEFSHRLDLFGPEIFAALNDKKVALEAEGRHLFNLSVGTPDFAPADHIKQALIDAARDNENWKYSLRDLPELLDAVCSYYKRRFDVDTITPDKVMSFFWQPGRHRPPGPGAVQRRRRGAAARPLLPRLYDRQQAGRRRPLVLQTDKGKPLLARRHRHPRGSGPQGKVHAGQPARQPGGQHRHAGALRSRSVDFCRKYDILLVHDNAYSDIIFDGAHGGSIFNTPGAEECAVEFFSLSKSFNVTGARISFLVGRPDVIAACKKLRTQIDFGMFLPMQKAAIAALTGPLDGVKRQCGEYQRPPRRPVRRPAQHRLERTRQPRQHVCVGSAAHRLHRQHGLLPGTDRQGRRYLHAGLQLWPQR